MILAVMKATYAIAYTEACKKVRTLTGFERVTPQQRCDALTN